MRVFKQGISEEQLRKIILAGTKAPSGSNVQPWEFIIIDDPGTIEQIAEHKYQQTLKMTIDEMILNDPGIIEQIYQQTLKTPLSTRRALNQKNAYLNCTVIAVCNKKGHGIGRKPWMNTENIASTWMCIENMALAATADGLGMVTSILREEHKRLVDIKYVFMILKIWKLNKKCHVFQNLGEIFQLILIFLLIKQLFL